MFYTVKIYTGLHRGHHNVTVFVSILPASSEPRKSQWSKQNKRWKRRQNKEWLMVNISSLNLEMTGLPYLCCQTTSMCFCLMCNDQITDQFNVLRNWRLQNQISTAPSKCFLGEIYNIIQPRMQQPHWWDDIIHCQISWVKWTSNLTQIKESRSFKTAYIRSIMIIKPQFHCKVKTPKRQLFISSVLYDTILN